MEIEKRTIKKASLEKLIESLKRDGKTIIAPVEKGSIIDLCEISSLHEMAEDYLLSVKSAKSAAFPKIEKLFDFEIKKEGINTIKRNLGNIPEVVLFGVRPCDAFGFDSLSAIFNWDSKDAIYQKRFEKLSIIAFSCNKADDYCFCTSVKGSPGSTDGSDILLTFTGNDEFLAEIITEKGKTIVEKSGVFEDAKEIDKTKYLADVPVFFDLNKVIEKTGSSFENKIWSEQSLRCVGCGACAFVCPTCACFDIQDESNGKQGSRIRLWDSCGFSLLTLHASGHNPRKIQFSRWRQRIMHKFAYMPDRLDVVGCVGCGRCSRSCPVDMNIIEHLINIEKD